MKCNFTKFNNKSCKAHAMDGANFCYLHNPAIPQDEKTINQKRGGKNRRLFTANALQPIKIEELDDVKEFLVETINGVRGGQLDIKVANCLGYLSGHLIRSFEASDVQQRIKALEDKILFYERI